MTSPIQSMLLLLGLQSLLVATARRMQGRVQVYHPGQSPYHVTRLHRYDHSGIDSMLEQEARWTQEMKELSSLGDSTGTVLKEAHPIGGASLLEEKATEHSEFVQLSDIQAWALLEHHRAWGSNTREGAGAAPSDALIQKFKSHLTTHNQTYSGDRSVVATGLTRLSSQYVGPIGVGTTATSPECVTKKNTTSANASSSILGKIGGFFSGLQTKATVGNATVASSSGDACKVEEQSKIWVVFDTGSTNIWISSDLCKSGACRLPGRHMFNHTASATFKYPQSMMQLSIQFGTGKITGPMATDEIHIGPFAIYNQTFAMIETETGSVFNDVPFEGIVGMAFDKMSANNVQPFFSSLIQQKTLQHNEFAFYFSRDNPSANAIFWGGVDKKFYEGKLQYFPVVDPYYWSLKLLNFKIGNDVILGASNTYDGTSNTDRKWKGPVAVVDTGTTFFTADSDKFGEVLSKLPHASCNDVTDKTHPPITITLENAAGQPKDFVLTNKMYMTKSKDNCSPAFMQIDIPREHGPGIILGEVFLRHFFAVFDRDTGKDSDAKVAFAKSANGDDTFSRLHELTAGQPSFGKSDAGGATQMLGDVQ